MYERQSKKKNHYNNTKRTERDEGEGNQNVFQCPN